MFYLIFKTIVKLRYSEELPDQEPGNGEILEQSETAVNSFYIEGIQPFRRNNRANEKELVYDTSRGKQLETPGQPKVDNLINSTCR